MNHYKLNSFAAFDTFMPVCCARTNENCMDYEDLMRQYGIDAYSMLRASCSLVDTVKKLSIKDVDKAVFGFTAMLDKDGESHLDLYFCDNLSEFKIEPSNDCREYIATAFDSTENKYILYGELSDQYYSNFYGDKRNKFGSKYVTKDDSKVCERANNVMKYFKDVIVAYKVTKSAVHKSIHAKFEFTTIENVFIDTKSLVREAVTNIASNTDVNYSAISGYKNDIDHWHKLFGYSYDNLFDQINALKVNDEIVIGDDNDSLFLNAIYNQKNKYKDDVSFVTTIGFLGCDFITKDKDSFVDHLTRCMKLDLAISDCIKD